MIAGRLARLGATRHFHHGLLGAQAPAKPAAAAKGVMLLNRIGPSSMELYVAKADGSGERRVFPDSAMDYHASFSIDGQWIVFTSERGALGQADIYRARLDGSGVERLTDHPAVDDQAALSPDGTQLAFISTRETRTAHVWLLDLKTRRVRPLTNRPATAAAQVGSTSRS